MTFIQIIIFDVSIDSAKNY